MTKLYIFNSVEDAIRFERAQNEEPSPTNEATSPTNIDKVIDDVRITTDQTPTPKPHRKYKKHTKPEGVPAKRAVVRHCKKCGEPGHRSDGCPNVDPSGDLLDQEKIDYIKEKAEEGMTISEIAVDTGLPEKIVKRYW